jgi:hypothetical protein
MTIDDIESRLAQLSLQQALQTEALGRIVEGHWLGADGAAGSIVALRGGVAGGFQPVAGPKD